MKRKWTVFLWVILSVCLLSACGNVAETSTEADQPEETLAETTAVAFTEEPTEWYEAATYVEEETPYGRMMITSFERKPDLTLEMFRQFTPMESTEDEVMSVVGKPHALYGYGHIASVYFTSDNYAVAVYYTTKDNVSVLDRIVILHEDGTYEFLMKSEVKSN